MTRVFRYRNFGLYIGDERGERHHLPHAHIKERGRLICTINLYTLLPLQSGKHVPAELTDELEARREEMLEIWEGLNDERE
jgi:hypothetical protein